MATNDVYLRPDAGDGTNGVRLRPDGPDAGGVTGTLAATEAQDTSLFAGAIGHTGTLAATEAQDTASFAGVHGQTGTIAATEAQDTASIAGTVTAGVSITGTLDAPEAQDVAAFEGTASQQVIWLGGSEAKKKTKRKSQAQEWKEQQELRREQIAQAVMAKTQAAVMRDALVPSVQEKPVLPVLQVEQEDEDELLLMLAA